MHQFKKVLAIGKSVSDIVKNSFGFSLEEGTFGVWSVPRLWKVTETQPTVQVDMSEFEQMLNNPCDFGEPKDKNTQIPQNTSMNFIDYIRTRNGSLIKDVPDRLLQGHVDKVLNCDLAYPIIIIKKESGSVERVLDGNHRLVKASSENVSTISSKIFSEMPSPDLVFENPQDYFELKRDFLGM
jgi:hypothetical protein